MSQDKREPEAVPSTAEPGRQGSSTAERATVRFHRIVREAKGIYRGRRPAADGFYVTREVHGLKLRASRGSLDRVLRLADLLLKAAEAMDYTVGVGTDAHAGAHVLIDGEPVGVGIKEGVDRVRHVPTKAELEEKKRWSWSRIPEFEYRPSGVLTVVLGSPRGAQAHFSEGKRWKLEERIEAILEGMRKASVALRHERLEREKWQLHWEERQRREAEAVQHRHDEQQRVDRLDKQLETWRRAKEIRAFVAEVKALVVSGGQEIDPDGTLGQWLAWVEAYAEGTDSLRELRRQVDQSGPRTDAAS